VFGAEGGGRDTLTLLLLGLPASGWIQALMTPAWSAAQVFGAEGGGGDALTGPRRHPFFLLGFKLGPDEPRGSAWFTYQVRVLQGCCMVQPGVRG